MFRKWLFFFSFSFLLFSSLANSQLNGSNKTNQFLRFPQFFSWKLQSFPTDFWLTWLIFHLFLKLLFLKKKCLPSSNNIITMALEIRSIQRCYKCENIWLYLLRIIGNCSILFFLWRAGAVSPGRPSFCFVLFCFVQKWFSCSQW